MGEHIAIDARAVSFGSKETITPASAFCTHIAEALCANDAFEVELDFGAGCWDLELDGVVTVILWALVCGDLIPAVPSIGQ